MARPAASAEVQPSGRRALDDRSKTAPELASQRCREASEFRAPSLERAEVALQADAEPRRLAGWLELAVAAETGEIEFVQSHGVRRDQLFTLQPR